MSITKLLKATTVLLFAFSPTITLADGSVTKVTKERWITEMRNIFPAYICRDNWYIRTCFDISADECHVKTTEATESCLRQYSSQIPPELEQPMDGKLWGTKIGTCAGTITESQIANKRIYSEKCQTLSEGLKATKEESNFQERVEKAKSVELTREFQEYASKLLFPDITSKVSQPMQECLLPANASKEPFVIVADLSASGEILNVDFEPKTNTATCFIASFRKLRFEPPAFTKGPLPIYIEMDLKGNSKVEI